jgi:Tfp pilus assembly protein PilN
MSQKNERPQLIIEWDKEWSRVTFTETGQSKEGATLGSIEGIQGKTAVLLLSRKMILSRVVSLPDAQKSDALVALKMKVGDIFPFQASDLAFDFLPTPSRDNNGRVCQVFAVKTSDIQSALSLTEELNITVHSILPAQATIIGQAANDNLANAIYVERFGDTFNLDVVVDSKLVASKSITTTTYDLELQRAAVLAPGAPVLGVGIPFDRNEQRLSGIHATRLFEINPAIDLEPESYRQKKQDKERAKRHRFSYLVFMAGVTIALVAYTNMGDEAEKIAKQKKSLNNKVKLAKLSNESATLERDSYKPQADQLKLAFQPAQKMSDVIKLSSMLLPKDAWLSSLSLDRGKPLQIRGTAKNSEAVSAYLKELTKQKRLRDVRLLFANSGDIEGAPVVQFSITAFPVGNLPIIEIGKVRKK